MIMVIIEKNVDTDVVKDAIVLIFSINGVSGSMKPLTYIRRPFLLK